MPAEPELPPDAAPSPIAADRPRPKQPEVLVTTATTGEGIPELLASLDRHRAAGQGGAATSTARMARAEAQVWAILADRTRAELDTADRREATAAILRAVADHELDPFTAVDRLLASLRG
jgi:LAO/AO transport system kinase